MATVPLDYLRTYLNDLTYHNPVNNLANLLKSEPTSVNFGTVNDMCKVMGSVTIQVLGALTTDAVNVGSSTNIPDGISLFSKVIAANTVAVEAFNASGFPIALGSLSLIAEVVQ